MKKTALILGSLLVLGSSVKIWLDLQEGKFPRLELALSRLGIYPDETLADNARRYLNQGDARSIELSVAGFTEALRRDASSPYRWCDLGEALLAAGQQEKALACYRRGLELGPELAPILWRVSRCFLELDRQREALPYLARILEKTEALDTDVFAAIDAAGIPAADVLAYGLPEKEPRAGRAWFRHILGRADIGDVRAAWDWLMARNFVDNQLAASWQDLLLRRKDYAGARDSWIAYLGDRQGPWQRTQFIFNGDFEAEPTGAAFDWRTSAPAGVTVAPDDMEPGSGVRSMKVSFDGEHNVSFQHISQLTVLPPGSYRFSGALRTAGITTDQGVGFRITDAESPARLTVVTAALTGTHDWTRIEADFKTAPETRLIRVEVIRLPSRKFDNKIQGAAWIDDISISLR